MSLDATAGNPLLALGVGATSLPVGGLSVLGLVGVVILLGVGAQWLGWRLGLPSILLLLLAGIIAGPFTGLLDSDQLSSEWLLPLASVSVALIVYEGGLTLRYAELRGIGRTLRNLVTIGAAVTWVTAAVAARLIFGLDWAVCILLGAVLVVTGPTVVGPLLRQIRPIGDVGSILKWEGIVIDPIGAVLAVLVFECISIGRAPEATEHLAWAISKTIVVGGGVGFVAAVLLVVVLHLHWVPEYLQNATSLMLVVGSFVLCNHVQHESGFVAVTVMGIALANQRVVEIRHIVEFKENLRVLLIGSLFILLAARLEIRQMAAVWMPGLIFLAALVLVCRPLSVLVSTIGSRLKRSERIFLAWMAPRGIVAAAVSSVFALRLEQETAFQGAGLLVPITFFAIIGTVAVYGLTSGIVARRLRLAESSPQGMLIVGASAWVRALAGVLKEKGFRVLLVDSNRDNTAAARMAGLPTYTGSALADYALDELNLGGIGRLLALTPNNWVNVLIVQRFAGVFGRPNCFQLASRQATGKQKPGDARQSHKHLHGRLLFGDEVYFDALQRRFAAGEVFKATHLGDAYTYEDFRRMYGQEALVLFVLKASNRLQFVTAGATLKPVAGDTLISLVKETAEKAAEKGRSTAAVS